MDQYNIYVYLKKINPTLGKRTKFKYLIRLRLNIGFKTDSSIIALYPPKLFNS